MQKMYENGSRSVIIESSNGYSLSGVQTKKCILISGIILGFPGFENILLEFVSKPHLSPQDKVSIFNRNMEESLSSLKLNDSEHYLKVDSIIFSDIVYQTLKENSFDRFFDIRTVEKDLNDDAGLLFMMCSTFVVLKERHNTENKRSGRVSSSVNDFLRSTSNTQLHQGMDVVVEYSPFVASSLLNSWSTGIISQVYGEDSCIFVTDVHLTTQGSTGAPVYRFVNQSLILLLILTVILK
ncbi:uncharacterized protein LOC111054857 [Nilaparvata lugens]|uniref:uncharacterized protein LOC111054857 n=1 Tax=Nilaparvata lugens TaxID=108931 RepID=UPI00193CED80|nr:uncharacterized protein LOC111054857 [Nilaparvata lugens]